MTSCAKCGAELRHIDRDGRHLVGCVSCNKWGDVDDNSVWFSLSPDDIRELDKERRNEVMSTKREP